MLYFLAAGAYWAWHNTPTWRAALKNWLTEWGLPPALVAMVSLAIMAANYARFGVLATTDMGAPGYWSAYRALVGIRPEQALRFVPVTREARLRAYAASPHFREVEPYLEGKLGEWYASFGREFYDLPRGEIAGGWFCWALRDAAAAAGHCRSTADSEAFYQQVADELRAAADLGKVETRPVLPFGVDPYADNYWPHLPASAAKLWQRCWSPKEPARLEDHPTDIRQFFDAMAHRRLVPPPPTAQARVRSWLWSLYGPLLSGVLLAGGLLFAALLVLRRNTPGRGWYFFIALALGLAGFSRLGLFVLIDASAFPGDALRYLFPAALTLVALAVWLSAEGLLLFFNPKVVARRVRMVQSSSVEHC
jgi:hypothetical protein